MRSGKIERIAFTPLGPFWMPRLNLKEIDATEQVQF
jgi:hypothetical protein